MALVLIIALLVLMFIGVPIAFALGLSAVFTLTTTSEIPLLLLAQRMFTSLDSVPLMAIPLFILAGNLMSEGGMSRRLVDVASAFAGHIKGGLAMVCVITTMIFSCISGSSAATVAAVGAILIPAMINKGYDKRFAAATQATAGELGSILPPSIPLVLYGIAANVSIGSLFMGGVLPGLLIGFSLMVVVFVMARVNNFPREERASRKVRKEALKKSVLAILMPIIILGGIYGGVFTPTEAAAAAVIYGFIVGIFVFKEIKFKDLPRIFGESAVLTASIMVILATAGLFGWILTQAQVPHQLAELFSGLTSSPIVFLLIINLLLLVVGMFFETGSSIIILAPILTPVAVAYGIDPVHFGIIMVVNLAMGMITPPMGVNLFIACRISNISLEQIVRGLVPYLLILIVDLMLISYLPAMSTWLPSLTR